MSKILIVDDSPVDQRLAGKLLVKRFGVDPEDAATGLIPLYASNGKEALEMIARESPDLVLTDLQMPEMNGLNLVMHVRIRFPMIPVILMTAHGSEELAVQALHAGAASYVPKRDLANDLLFTVESVLETAQAKRSQHALMQCLTQTESQFVLTNDPSLISPLMGYLKENVFRMSGSDDTGLIQMTMALREAILNAMEHGNLELNSALKENDETSYHQLGQERRKLPPYQDRRVFLTARENPKEAIYIIRDEGPGFDTKNLPDPTDPVNLEKSSGRGLFLMRTFMSEIRHNEKGNEITLIRRVADKQKDSDLL